MRGELALHTVEACTIRPSFYGRRTLAPRLPRCAVGVGAARARGGPAGVAAAAAARRALVRGQGVGGAAHGERGQRFSDGDAAAETPGGSAARGLPREVTPVGVEMGANGVEGGVEKGAEGEAKGDSGAPPIYS